MKIKCMAAMAAAAVCAVPVMAGDYDVKVTGLGEDADGAMAYMQNFDTGERIDSVLVADGAAVFKGNNPTLPMVVRIWVDGDRRGQCVAGEGAVVYDAATRKAQGGASNAALDRLESQINALGAEYQAAPDTAKQAVIDRATALTDSTMRANAGNPMGYYLFLQQAYEMTLEQLQVTLEANPGYKQYVRVQKLLDSMAKKAATQEGGMFADFEIEYDGVKHRLSDVVGKGDYVLVDFWASWCGPCIRQTQVIKEIYKKYGPVGLKVLGVAVWDEPEATKAAIKSHDLPWEAWLNGQNVPTDAYGISGIPCIILFGPDGTILSRDKQSEELVADVEKYFKK